MTTLQTEKVTLTGQVLPDRIGEATFWIVYPLTFANCRQVEDRIARAWGTGPTYTEALRDAASR